MKDREKLKIAIQALKDIVDPIGKIKREMKPGYVLDGQAAILLSNNFCHLKELAIIALGEIGEHQ